MNNTFNLLYKEKPTDRDYAMASLMTGLDRETIEKLNVDISRPCDTYPVTCITSKCPCLEQCYGIGIKQKYA